MRILALEESTSSAKALIYDSDLGIIDVQSTPYPKEYCDVYTQDADGIFHCLIGTAKNILTRQNKNIDAISLSSIWPCLLLLDRQYRPLTKILTWADTSCASTVAKYKALYSAQSFYKSTGCTMHSIYGLWKYIHLRDTQPEIIDRTATITSQGGYLAYQLTGENVCSKSSASANGFLNVHTLEWDEHALTFAGITVDKLPKLCEASDVFSLSKKAAKLLGLREGIPVIIGGGDGALNQLGSSATKSGIMTFSMGTSAAIRLSQKSGITRDISLWCYYLTEGIRLIGAATSGAGNCVNWFKNTLLSGNFSFSELESKMKTVDKVNAPVFLPFLFGERCPGWNDLRKGGFVGLTGSHTTGELYYSLLEGILFNVYQCYEKIVENASAPSKIIVSGGITNSIPWLQMASDIFKVPMCVSKEEHASIMGAVVLALKSFGQISSYDEYTSPIEMAIEPDGQRAAHYAIRYKDYLEKYQNAIF